MHDRTFLLALACIAPSACGPLGPGPDPNIDVVMISDAFVDIGGGATFVRDGGCTPLPAPDRNTPTDPDAGSCGEGCRSVRPTPGAPARNRSWLFGTRGDEAEYATDLGTLVRLDADTGSVDRWFLADLCGVGTPTTRISAFTVTPTSTAYICAYVGNPLRGARYTLFEIDRATGSRCEVLSAIAPADVTEETVPRDLRRVNGAWAWHDPADRSQPSLITVFPDDASEPRRISLRTMTRDPRRVISLIGARDVLVFAVGTTMFPSAIGVSREPFVSASEVLSTNGTLAPLSADPENANRFVHGTANEFDTECMRGTPVDFSDVSVTPIATAIVASGDTTRAHPAISGDRVAYVSIPDDPDGRHACYWTERASTITVATLSGTPIVTRSGSAVVALDPRRLWFEFDDGSGARLAWLSLP